jgi:hypothetical protein
MREEDDKSMEWLNQTRDEPGKRLICGAVTVVGVTEVKVVCKKGACGSVNCQLEFHIPER